MTQLDISKFVRICLLEAVRLMPGTRVYFDGANWEAVEQNTGKNGWLWRIVSGKNPNWNPDVDTKFFTYPQTSSRFEKSIYNEPMDNSNVIDGKQPIKDTRKSDEVTMPPGVDSPETAFAYAKKHPKWTEGEYYIAQNPKLASKYARLTGKPFYRGELSIIKDPEAASDYAVGVLRKRWQEAEPVIKTEPYAWKNYIISFPDAAK